MSIEIRAHRRDLAAEILRATKGNQSVMDEITELAEVVDPGMSGIGTHRYHMIDEWNIALRESLGYPDARPDQAAIEAAKPGIPARLRDEWRVTIPDTEIVAAWPSSAVGPVWSTPNQPTPMTLSGLSWPGTDPRTPPFPSSPPHFPGTFGLPGSS